MGALICPNHGASRPNPTGFCKLCGARLIANDTEASAPGARKVPQVPALGAPVPNRIALIGAVVAVVVIGVLAWRILGSPGDASISPTAVPSSLATTPQGTSPAGLAASAVPTHTPAATATTPSQAATSASASPATQAVTPAPMLPSATGIDPQRTFVGALPLTLTVSGEHLDQVEKAILTRADGALAMVDVESRAAGRLTLIVRELPQSEDREATFTLWLDGQAQEAAQLVVQNYIANKTVSGAKADYIYTNRINPDPPHNTRMRAEAAVGSQPGERLINGDKVDILRDDVEGWYFVRIQDSPDQARIGASGWIECWLIDDVGVPTAPPTATPLPVARFTSRIDVNFVGSGNSQQFRSCVAGRVYRSNGRLYPGARINVNNGPKNSFNAQTGGDGVYRVCGLGASNWSVVLRNVPGARLAQQVVKVVYVNGSSGQEAIVHFFQQP